MSEFKVGDKVWVKCEVLEILQDGTCKIIGNYGSAFWTVADELKALEFEPVESEAVKTVGPKTICVGDSVIYRGMKGVVLEWFEATQLFSFQSERGYKGCVRESDLKPIEPKPEVKQPTTTATHYGPDISRVSFEFTQDPNTLGTTDASGCGSEDLTVECEYQLPGEEPFFVIRSTSGWSFDEPETLLALLNSVKDAEKKCRCSLPQS
jgi:hypothetical protein